MKHEHTFTLDWSLEETNFAIEPCSRLFGGPFVLDSERQLHSATTVTLHMKINAPKLCLHNSSVNVHLLWMKMKLNLLEKQSAEERPPKLSTTQKYFDSCAITLRVS
jgi:hypothetical protein